MNYRVILEDRLFFMKNNCKDIFYSALYPSATGKTYYIYIYFFFCKINNPRNMDYADKQNVP